MSNWNYVKSILIISPFFKIHAKQSNIVSFEKMNRKLCMMLFWKSFPFKKNLFLTNFSLFNKNDDI